MRGPLRNAIFCHPRLCFRRGKLVPVKTGSGDPEPINFIALIDSRFHGNDIFIHFATVP